MTQNGKKTDVLIEDVTSKDSAGMIVVSDRYFYVWADAGLSSTINGVDGVCSSVTCYPDKTRYMVTVDMRYDFNFVKKEVEAALLCL